MPEIIKLRLQANNNNGYIISGFDNVLKVDNNGGLIWRQSITPIRHVINSVAVNNDGSIYAAGLVVSDSANDNVVEALLGKLDQNGVLLWHKKYFPTTRDEFHDLTIHDNVLVGLLCTDQDNRHFRMQKLDLEGAIIWDKEYPSPWGYVSPESLIKTREGNYVFTGYYLGPYETPYFYLEMVDPNGNTIWRHISDNTVRGYSVAETKDNALIVTGGYMLSSSSQAVLYKFDKAGNKLWRSLYPEFSTYLINKSVIPTDDGGYIINSQKSKAYNGHGETDQIYIFKTDDLGNF